MKLLLLAATLLLPGCTFDCHIECDLGIFTAKAKVAPAAKPPPVDPFEERDMWLDATGRVQAQAHGWLLTPRQIDGSITLYHLSRPLPAERP